MLCISLNLFIATLIFSSMNVWVKYLQFETVEFKCYLTKQTYVTQTCTKFNNLNCTHLAPIEDESICGTCGQDEPPEDINSGKTVHWVSCDKCGKWHHW
jgi:hypothetical protein